MPRNEYCLRDIMYITRPTRDIMRIMGIWPSIRGETTLCEKVYKLLLIIISYALFLGSLIPGYLYWLIQADAITRIQMMSFLLFESMNLSQYSIIILRDDYIRRCLRHVEEDWENVPMDVRHIMLQFARIGKRLVTTCACFMYCGALLFRTILPLLQDTIVTEQNVTIRPFGLPAYFFSVDLQATPIYETLFTIQTVGGFTSASVSTSACGLTALFVLHASGQLRILRDLMTKLVEEKWQNEYEVDKKLADIVEHQIRVRSFLRLAQHTLQQTVMMEVMVNTLILCVIMYFIVIEWQNSNKAAVCIYILCIGNLTIHIFMFCYAGEQLTVQAEKVATVSCELEWYRLPNKKARYVVLLMMMSNAPTKISAGNLFDLSLRTFGDVRKWIQTNALICPHICKSHC